MQKNKRIQWLVIVGCLLGLAVLYDQSALLQNQEPGDYAAIVTDNSQPQQDMSALLEKKAKLLSLKNSHEEVSRAYTSLAPAYAENSAELLALLPDFNDVKSSVEGLLKAKLEQSGTVGDVRITVGDAVPVSENAQKLLCDVYFRAVSSSDALGLLKLLGDSKAGMFWNNFSVLTDRTRKEITVSGRLYLFVTRLAE